MSHCVRSETCGWRRRRDRAGRLDDTCEQREGGGDTWRGGPGGVVSNLSGPLEPLPIEILDGVAFQFCGGSAAVWSDEWEGVDVWLDGVSVSVSWSGRVGGWSVRVFDPAPTTSHYHVTSRHMHTPHAPRKTAGDNRLAGSVELSSNARETETERETSQKHAPHTK